MAVARTPCLRGRPLRFKLAEGKIDKKGFWKKGYWKSRDGSVTQNEEVYEEKNNYLKKSKEQSFGIFPKETKFSTRIHSRKGNRALKNWKMPIRNNYDRRFGEKKKLE